MTLHNDLFVSLIVVDSIGILVCLLLLFLYLKLQILMKPPGSLIFMQILAILAIRIVEILLEIVFHRPNYPLEYTICVYIYIFSLVTVVNYAICISLEVIRRVRNSPMGKNYRKRVRFYHVYCNLTSLLHVLMLAIYLGNDESMGSMKFDARNWIW